MADNVTMTIPIVTVSDLALPRWMSPFARQLFAIPTHMTAQERLMLMQLALNAGDGFTALEIGSYLGASTAFLGFSALHKNGTVHAVDPWTNNAMGSEGERDTFGEFRRNTASFEHYIVPHRGTSAEIHARETVIPCNLLFIDGDHSYDAVAADLRMWLPSLKPGGTLAMHDIDSPPVAQAFNEIAPSLALEGPPQMTDRLLFCKLASA